MAFQEFTGIEYLKIDIANSYGLDKLTWYQRLSWFDANEPNLDALVNVAKESALFHAGIKAYKDVQAGKPIGYMISLDATSSGLQLLAVLTGDDLAAKLCNVVDTGKREDAYTNIYEEMVDSIHEQTKINRDEVKDAIMTSLYGSTAMPKAIFGEGKLLDVFYGTMKEMAPAAWELNEAMLQMWNPDAYSHDWVLPDNFHVHVKVMDRHTEKVNFLNQPFDISYAVNRPMEEGRSLGANSIHSVDGMIAKEISRRCDYDPERIGLLREQIAEKRSWNNATLTNNDNLVVTLWDHYKKSGYLSARILQHINPDNGGHVDMTVISALLDTLPKKPFKVVSVHDCFRCLPHYGNDLRRQYNLQLKLIAESDLLSYIISQIIGKPINVGKQSYGLPQSIMDTNYALS